MNDMTQLQAKIADGDLAALKTLLNYVYSNLFDVGMTEEIAEPIRARIASIRVECRETISFIDGVSFARNT